jgi:predicted P-loop ATPase
MQQIDLFKNFLNNHYNFRFNEISCKVEFKPISGIDYKPMTDRYLNSLLLEMNHQRLKIKFLDLKTIIESDFVPIFNPIKDYFKSLPQMTGNENIKKLLKTIDTHDNDFFEWAFTKWLVAWVACMVEDSAINQQCVILAGNQGIGKSTWVEKLIPNELMPYYFAGNIRLGNKDTLGFLSEKCLINLDELANMTYSNVAELKELVTKSKISFRKAYAQYTDNFIRRASFIGSVNGTEFLYDLTGNRRFLSFEVSRFENYGNHNDNMNLVLAEVYSLFKSGFQYWFDANDQKRVEKNNENFRVISPEEVKILELFSCNPLDDNVIENIKEELLNSIGRNRFESVNRISLRKSK